MADDRRPVSHELLTQLQIVAVAGCLFVILYACRFWASGDVVRIATVGMLIAASSLLAGFLTGFIFGIPRVVSDISGGVQANDNLIEISNWLTKILVGVGLIELSVIPGKLWALAARLESGLRPAQCAGNGTCTDLATGAQAAALAIVIFYFTFGFLWGYIWTRIYFERDLGAKVAQLKREKVELKQDKEATDLVLAAELSINNGQLDDAMRAVEKLLRNDPRDGRAVMTKGRILKREATQAADPEIRQNLLQQALDCAKKAVELMPGIAAPIYNKACYEALLGTDRAEVLLNLEEAFRLDPTLRKTAPDDSDLDSLREDADFIALVNAKQSP
ncbi:MAG TPA: hypothetical protein VFA99_09045 [Acidobacteriaceae bacterium]|nr:hypothetical protein [Acidobacteriaceae bacterium]